MALEGRISTQNQNIGDRLTNWGLSIRDFSDHLDYSTRKMGALNLILPMIGYPGVAIEYFGRLISLLERGSFH